MKGMLKLKLRCVFFFIHYCIGNLSSLMIGNHGHPVFLSLVVLVPFSLCHLWFNQLLFLPVLLFL